MLETPFQHLHKGEGMVIFFSLVFPYILLFPMSLKSAWYWWSFSRRRSLQTNK